MVGVFVPGLSSLSLVFFFICFYMLGASGSALWSLFVLFISKPVMLFIIRKIMSIFTKINKERHDKSDHV